MVDKRYQLRSMTAYGRGSAAFSYGRFTFEIQSVNRRYLEITVNLPRIFIRFEHDIRKHISAHLGRGMINVSLFWRPDANYPVSVVPNLALARSIKAAWEKLADELTIQEKIPLSLIVQEKDILSFENEIIEEGIYQTAIDEALQKALDALLDMKQQEGMALADDLKGRLRSLQKEIDLIEDLAKGGPDKYRQKLSKRLEEFLTGNAEQEERILREIAIYAERIDVAEEITRFKSHLEQFWQTIEKPLESPSETRAKTMEFLLQELLRESNTIGSKASDLAIVQHVVTMKSELEKLREQLQNIE